MDQTMLLYVAVAVFSLMVIGLGLTIWEFSRGSPHKQVESYRSDQNEIPSDGSAQPS